MPCCRPPLVVAAVIVRPLPHLAMKRFQEIALCTLMGGIILGGIGFVGGFFGPIIFTPQANQGPLLGIFITGPLGFILGAMIGFTVGVIRGAAKKP